MKLRACIVSTDAEIEAAGAAACRCVAFPKGFVETSGRTLLLPLRKILRTVSVDPDACARGAGRVVERQGLQVVDHGRCARRSCS